MRKFKIIITVIGIFLLLISFGNIGSTGSIKIGTQTWATKNLDLNTFRNGDSIPEAKTVVEWVKSGDEHKPAWCNYNNDPAFGEKYGKLYNWYAVNDPRGLAPAGWHVPSDAEWTSMTDNLGVDAGTQMKSTSGWSLNGNGTNKSGFTAFPSGYRYSFGTYIKVGSSGFWWSSTEHLATSAFFRSMNNNNSIVIKSSYNKGDGFSVRCLQD